MIVQNLGILQNTNSYDPTNMQYKGIWKFNSYDWNGYYLHMKTNINTVNMWMFEAIGYNYCQATKIRSAWTFHFDGGNIYNVSYRWLGGVNGLQPTNVYRSGDGYMVIAGYSPCWGYSGFMLNAYNTADNYYQSFSNNSYPEIIASVFSGSNNPVY